MGWFRKVTERKDVDSVPQVGGTVLKRKEMDPVPLGCPPAPKSGMFSSPGASMRKKAGPVVKQARPAQRGLTQFERKVAKVEMKTFEDLRAAFAAQGQKGGIVLDLFSGSGIIGEQARLMGLPSLSLDIMEGWDLTDPALKTELLTQIKSGSVCFDNFWPISFLLMIYNFSIPWFPCDDNLWMVGGWSILWYFVALSLSIFIIVMHLSLHLFLYFPVPSCPHPRRAIFMGPPCNTFSPARRGRGHRVVQGRKRRGWPRALRSKKHVWGLQPSDFTAKDPDNIWQWMAENHRSKIPNGLIVLRYLSLRCEMVWTCVNI